MSKKLIIIIAVLVTFLLVAGLILVFIKKPTTENPVPVVKLPYDLQIFYENENMTGIVLQNNIWTDLKTRGQIEDYALISFNNTHDILWALCKDDYRLTKASSDTDKNIFIEPSSGASITLFDGQKNSLNISCSAK